MFAIPVVARVAWRTSGGMDDCHGTPLNVVWRLGLRLGPLYMCALDDGRSGNGSERWRREKERGCSAVGYAASRREGGKE